LLVRFYVRIDSLLRRLAESVAVLEIATLDALVEKDGDDSIESAVRSRPRAPFYYYSVCALKPVG